LNKILSKFKKHNIKLNLQKCLFFVIEVEYCGMNVLENKIQISKEKLEKIVSIKPPNNRKELQQILGFFNYFSRFIYNYSFYVGPMYKLLNKNSKFEWNENTQRKFDDLKEEK